MPFKPRLWAFYIYDAEGRKKGIEMFSGKARAETEREHWRQRGYNVGKMWKQ